MSSTTIRIHPAEKLKLEKLQAKIFLQIGKKLAFPELLKLLLKSSEDEILEEIMDEIGRKTINWDIHMDLISDLGFDNSDDIDEIVYG